MRISDWSSDVCSSDLIIATRVDDDMLISVEDEGPGVPEAERQTIFRRFHSVRPNNEEFGQHNDLGLAIARSIVEGHHGTIRIVDREDSLHGARFEVRLPAAAPLKSEEHTTEHQQLM